MGIIYPPLAPVNVNQLIDVRRPEMTFFQAGSVSIHASVKRLRTIGRLIPNDGGEAWFKEVPYTPSHTTWWMAPDGRKFEIDEDRIVPEMAGPVGGIDDTTTLLNWADTVNALGARAELRPGRRRYALASNATIVIHGEFEGHDSVFVVPNNNQSNPAVSIQSRPEDVEMVAPATVNTWTQMNTGSRQIPQLTERDWVYTLTSQDAVIVNRFGSAGTYIGETFAVVSDSGFLSHPLVRDYNLPFSQVSCTRQRLRETLLVNNLAVEYSGGVGTQFNRGIEVTRPNTTLAWCYVKITTGKCQQGFVATGTFGVRYIDCDVSGPGVDTTNYGFNSGYSTDLTYDNCWGTECRRTLDAHGSKDIKINGGNFPDGIGAHWCDGLRANAATIGARNITQNRQCVHYAGSDIILEDCNFHMGIAGDIFCMRADIPEISGVCAIRGGTITFYDDDDAMTGRLATVMHLGTAAEYDTGRAVRLPSRIEVKPDRLIQRGPSSDNQIQLLALATRPTAAAFPRAMIVEGSAEVAVGAFELEGGSTVPNGSARLTVSALAGQTAAGAGMDVFIRKVPRLQFFGGQTSATGNGRYRLRLEDVPETSNFVVQYGSVKSLVCRRVDPTTLIQISGTAFGDECIGHEEEWENVEPISFNGFGSIRQRSGTSFADDTYGIDGWYVLTETGNVTASIAPYQSPGIPTVMQLQQPDVSAKRMGQAQIVETLETIRWRGKPVSIDAFVLAQPGAANLKIALLEWTGTADAVVSDVVNDWSSTDYSPGNFFIASNVLVRKVLTIPAQAVATPVPINLATFMLGATANNLILFIWTEGQFAKDAYFRYVIELKPGPASIAGRRRSYDREQSQCRRCLRVMTVQAVNGTRYIQFEPPLRVTPSVTVSAGTVANASPNGFELTHTSSTPCTVTATCEL